MSAQPSTSTQQFVAQVCPSAYPELEAQDMKIEVAIIKRLRHGSCCAYMHVLLYLNSIIYLVNTHRTDMLQLYQVMAHGVSEYEKGMSFLRR